MPPHRRRVLRLGEKDAPGAYGAIRCLAYVGSRDALRGWRRKMDDIKRALLGDKEAAKRLTDSGVKLRNFLN